MNERPVSGSGKLVANVHFWVKSTSRLQPRQRVELACELDAGGSFIHPLAAGAVRQHHQASAAREIENEQVGDAVVGTPVPREAIRAQIFESPPHAPRETGFDCHGRRVHGRVALSEDEKSGVVAGSRPQSRRHVWGHEDGQGRLAERFGRCNPIALRPRFNWSPGPGVPARLELGGTRVRHQFAASIMGPGHHGCLPGCPAVAASRHPCRHQHSGVDDLRRGLPGYRLGEAREQGVALPGITEVGARPEPAHQIAVRFGSPVRQTAGMRQQLTRRDGPGRGIRGEIDVPGDRLVEVDTAITDEVVDGSRQDRL